MIPKEKSPKVKVIWLVLHLLRRVDTWVHFVWVAMKPGTEQNGTESFGACAIVLIIAFFTLPVSFKHSFLMTPP